MMCIEMLYGTWDSPHAIAKDSGDLNKDLQGVTSRDAASIPWLILLALLLSILLELTW